MDTQAIDRRERLRRLALETIDLSKDPYFMRNHLGQYECRLCLTLHNNEGNYLAHTQASLLSLNFEQCRSTLFVRYAFSQHRAVAVQKFFGRSFRLSL